MEAAGGRASNGSKDILDLLPSDHHERTPLFLGNRDNVDDIETVTHTTRSVQNVDPIVKQLNALASEERAAVTRSFQTGKDAYSYAEHDVFIGIRVPVLRRLAQEHVCLSLDSVLHLLNYPFMNNDTWRCSLDACNTNVKAQRNMTENKSTMHTYNRGSISITGISSTQRHHTSWASTY